MEFCSLFSGSTGNCLFIRHKDTTLLCDAGRSGKQIENALKAVEARGEEVDGILVTHEHSDHMKAVGILSRRFNIPIYANHGTWEGLWKQKIGKIDRDNVRTFEVHKPFAIKDLQIKAFRTSHDCNEPVGFRIEDGSSSLGIATDTGYVTEDMRTYLNGCGLVVLESNHDVQMLTHGPYPFNLKKRISGNKGHLSNEAAAQFAAQLVEEMGTQHLILAHLSQENNLPSLAEKATRDVFRDRYIKEGTDVRLEVALRDTVGSLWRF